MNKFRIAGWALCFAAGNLLGHGFIAVGIAVFVAGIALLWPQSASDALERYYSNLQ
jgi:hypothetical protein